MRSSAFWPGHCGLSSAQSRSTRFQKLCLASGDHVKISIENLKYSMFTMFTMLLSRLTTHLSISELVFCTVKISGHKQQSLKTAFSHTDHPPTHKIKCCSQPFILYLKTSFKDLKFLKFAVFSTLLLLLTMRYWGTKAVHVTWIVDFNKILTLK